MKTGWGSLFILMAIAGCSSTFGEEVDPNNLGYRSCQEYYDCGVGRYCNAAHACFTDCRFTADCGLFGENQICNLYGQCLEPDGERSCKTQSDCGENRYCNRYCSLSGAHCESSEDCPLKKEGESCDAEGRCAAHCGQDKECLAYGEDMECAPVGQCLKRGWEKWLPPGELPPTRCDRDSQCKVLGWKYVCNCEKNLDPRTGLELCAGGVENVCVEDPDDLDFGNGPEDSPAHAYRGIWGMRTVTGAVTYNLPLIQKQAAYSSQLFLVKIVHESDDTLKFIGAFCDIQLINFKDDDTPADAPAWMLIPLRYLRVLPILDQTVVVHQANQGDPFETSELVEVRGCILKDPFTDPLPTRHDYDANPNDTRFWDQDKDGNVAMTVILDGIMRGEIYNVQRWKAQYNGVILDADHVRGYSKVFSEQNIIATSMGQNYDTTQMIHEDPTRTFFRLGRRQENASCAELIREAKRDDSWLKHSAHILDPPCGPGEHEEEVDLQIIVGGEPQTVRRIQCVVDN